MARFLDDIRRAGRFQMPHFVQPNKAEAWSSHASRLFEMFLKQPDMPVICVDNVSQWYYEGTGQENWDLTKDFPNLAPPYPLFWLEYKLPKRIHSDTKGDTDTSALGLGNGHVGWLFIGSEREDVTGEGIPENCRWIYSAELFIDYGLGREIQGPHGTWHAAIDAEGRLIDRPWMQSWAPAHLEHLVVSLNAWTHPALLAVSFMHCKNVMLEEHACPPKLAKRTHEKYGYAPVTYSTLVIEPLKQILRHEGRSDAHGLQRALHICRGHFKDYRNGRGLFGRYKVLVWHDSVVRGTRGEKAPPRNIEVKL